MEPKKLNIYSHLTAKERQYLSFPAKQLLNKGLLKGEILDFGCGFGKDVEVLKDKGLAIIGYDKHYFPTYPTEKFDTIICFYVLNVLMQEEQARVLMEVSSLLKPTGKAYFAVRRDIVYEGFRTHKIHQKPTYQCNVILPFNSFFKNESCEIYEYVPFHQRAKPAKIDCPFCFPDAEMELITESATAYAIFDKYPVNKGHALIIPKRHVDSYFDLTFREQSACTFMLNFVKELLQKRYNPDAFNVGINIGVAAGQTVHHAHIHLIPRFKGDVENPEGGIRGVIPEKRLYTKI
jgi:ATP adenylyltransferase